MRKILFSLVGILLLVGVADAAVFNFQVRDEQGRPIATGFTAQVYTIASTAAPDVVYPDTTYTTSITNPMVPDARGSFKFATSQNTVDIVIWGHGGRAMGATARVDDLTDQDHVIILDTQNVNKHLRIFWDVGISKGSEVNTGIQLPAGTVIDDIFIEVVSAVAKASVSVGLLSTLASGDADGFCVSMGADFAAVPGQFFRCEASTSRSGAIDGQGGREKIYYSSNTRGALIASFVPGQNTMGALGVGGTFAYASSGFYREYPLVLKQGMSSIISYTTNDITPGTNAAGYIHIFLRELKNRQRF